MLTYLALGILLAPKAHADASSRAEWAAPETRAISGSQAAQQQVSETRLTPLSLVLRRSTLTIIPAKIAVNFEPIRGLEPNYTRLQFNRAARRSNREVPVWSANAATGIQASAASHTRAQQLSRTVEGYSDHRSAANACKQGPSHHDAHAQAEQRGCGCSYPLYTITIEDTPNGESSHDSKHSPRADGTGGPCNSAAGLTCHHREGAPACRGAALGPSTSSGETTGAAGAPSRLMDALIPP